MSKKYWGVFWVAAVLLLFFMNGSLFITDSVESNYALTAKEMVLSGNWISPQIYGNFWYDKPIMFYWLCALGFKIFGFTEFGARFFPALFGLGGLAMVTWGARKLYNDKVAFYSGLILLTTIEYYLISKSIITDQALFVFFSGTLLFFILGYTTEQKNYYYGVYICSALATLTKGPIGFLLPGLIIVLFLSWEKNWQEVKRAKLPTGIVLFLLIGLPWYLAMFKIHGDAFLNGFLGTHNFLRATVSEHSRDNVIYYYLMVNIAAFFPWIGFVPGTFKHLFRPDGRWQTPPPIEKFLVLWTVVIFVFYQCMATKYITYTYPLLFPLAILVAAYIYDFQGKKIWAILGFNTVFYFIVMAVGLYLVHDWGNLNIHPMGIIILTVGCAALSVFQLFKYHKNKDIFKSVISIALIGFCFNFLSVQAIFEPFMSVRSAKGVGLMLKEHVPEQAVVGNFSDYDTSAVFYSGHKIYMVIPDKSEESFQPKAYSWSAKNVMPYMIYSKVQEVKPMYMICKTKNLERVRKTFPRQWNVIKIKNSSFVILVG